MSRRTSISALAALLAIVAVPYARAEMTLLRITPEQYQHAIHDIFGQSIKIDTNAVETGFRDQGLLAVGARKLTLTSAGLERDKTLAQQVATQVTDPKRRATLLRCQPKSEDAPDAGCTRAFLTRVGFYLFRRPLTDDEVVSFVKTADAASQTLHSFNAGLSAALVQMMVSPEFLFRVEQSTADPAHPGNLQLDAYGRASRLSFFLWDSAPDTELMAAAQSGKIMTREGLRDQVTRLMSSPRIEDGVRAFFADMLGFDAFATVTKDTQIFLKYTKNVEEDAREQTLRTIADQLVDRNRDYREIFTTRETFLTPALAAVYAVRLPRSQEIGGAVPWVPYEFPVGDPHVGILTQVSFLALFSHPGQTSPTLRGKALRENILCQKVPPPPGSVDFSLVQNTNDPNFKTARQRLTAHRKEMMCAGCHKITDPVGLALENFNSAGSFRTTENGAPIDASGEFNGKPFTNIGELAAIIRDDPGTTSCLVNRAYSYGAARAATAEETAWLTALQDDLRKNGVKWRELARRIAENADFYTMPVSETQSAQR